MKVGTLWLSIIMTSGLVPISRCCITSHLRKGGFHILVCYCVDSQCFPESNQPACRVNFFVLLLVVFLGGLAFVFTTFHAQMMS